MLKKILYPLYIIRLVCLLYTPFMHTMALPEKKIVVVTASYNNKDWYKKNLDSVFNQQYPKDHWHLYYVDDCSPDGTGALVEAYIAEKNMQSQVTLIKNSERCGAMANLYNTIHSCEKTAIIAVLDGDDSFAHNNVFTRLNQEYANPNVWLTYGQYREYPSGAHGFCVPMPSHIIEQNAYRSFPDGPSHLRTFYAGLFQQIKKNDLMFDGKFFSMTYDLAMMFPMMEMTGGKFKFIPEVLVEYNAANPLNDHKVSKDLQRILDIMIRNRKRYEPIKASFKNTVHKIGLLVVATGKYIQFIKPLVDSASKHFCTNHEVTYFVFTDGSLDENYLQEKNIKQIYQKRLGWPHDTLLRCEVYKNNQDQLATMDYLFACDADMLFADTVGDEILSERVATQSPGFVGKRGTYETGPHSTACVYQHEGSQYFAGGFYGGSNQEFTTMTNTMVANIYKDLQQNFIAVWHDESHLNRYFIDNPPTNILSPAYCYPERWNLPYTKRLLALDKNHNDMRN